MLTQTLIEIRNNPNYYRFLRDNSNWYKALNRNHNNLKLMDIEVKNYYKLNLSDKLVDINDKINIIRNLMDIMK